MLAMIRIFLILLHRVYIELSLVIDDFKKILKRFLKDFKKY